MTSSAMAVTCCLASQCQVQPRVELLVCINPVFPAKMTELRNEVIRRSVCLFLGGEMSFLVEDLVACLALGPHCSEYKVQAVPCFLSAASSARGSKPRGRNGTTCFPRCRRKDPSALEG